MILTSLRFLSLSVAFITLQWRCRWWRLARRRWKAQIREHTRTEYSVFRRIVQSRWVRSDGSSSSGTAPLHTCSAATLIPTRTFFRAEETKSDRRCGIRLLRPALALSFIHDFSLTSPWRRVLKHISPFLHRNNLIPLLFFFLLIFSSSSHFLLIFSLYRILDLSLHFSSKTSEDEKKVMRENFLFADFLSLCRKSVYTWLVIGPLFASPKFSVAHTAHHTHQHTHRSESIYIYKRWFWCCPFKLGSRSCRVRARAPLYLPLTRPICLFLLFLCIFHFAKSNLKCISEEISFTPKWGWFLCIFSN